MQTVITGKVIAIHYTLTSPEGEELDSSRGEDPMEYLHGAGNIVPGLEKQLVGKQVGDRFQAVVPAAEGYGEREEDGIETVPRDAFPADAELEVGMEIEAETAQGEVMTLWVMDVDAENVTIDRNHPLAGMVLHFDVEVMGVREATKDELDHGHPHGPDGHHH